MPVTWSASLGHVGRLRRRLVVALLFVVLLWLEMEEGMVCTTGISVNNKVCACGGSLGWRSGDGFLLLHRRGADGEEVYEADVVGSRRPPGKLVLQFGDSHTVALASHRDLWPMRRPLQTLSNASIQPPLRRPFAGFS
jgi:hypothetical protein